MSSAAPSLQDLTLMDKINLLAWKDKLQQYSSIEKLIPEMTQQLLHNIERCFLVMLDQTNVNVLNQVLSLIKVYITTYPITQIPVEELVSKIINFYNIQGLGIQEMIGTISIKSSRVKILEAIGVGIRVKTPKKIAKCYDILSSLVRQFGLLELMYLEGAIEDISAGFFWALDEVKQSVLNFMKELYSRAGPVIVHYARYMRYPLLERLEEFAQRYVQVAPFQVFPERMLYKEFSFQSKYPQDFIDQIITLKVKPLHDCLRQMKQDSEKKNLKQQNFQSILAVFVDLAKRRTPATSKLLISILNSFSQNICNFQLYSQTLVQILFQLVGCKQITELLSQSGFVKHVNFQHVQYKFVHLGENQAEYYKAIKLFKILYDSMSEWERDSIFGYLNGLNISYVYRLELEGIRKQEGSE